MILVYLIAAAVDLVGADGDVGEGMGVLVEEGVEEAQGLLAYAPGN